MLKTLSFILIFSIFISADSLYSDNVVNDTDLESQQLSDSYNYSQDYSEQNKKILSLLDTYMTSVFKLSQLTGSMNQLTNQSSIYSNISRLRLIADDLSKSLNSSSINLDGYYSPNFTQVGNSLNQVQSEFQETVFKLQVLSPYVPKLIYSNQDVLSYQIEYINRITGKLVSDIMELSKFSNQLGVGQQTNGLPFQPQSPDELSFALQQQLNQSVINMIGSEASSSSSDMPFSSMSTPTNTDFFNMNGASGMQQSFASPNASPLQQMQYIPNF